ncbi:MAG: CpsD/CapB family tyrosine-protein kinase [Clostridia bacterium]|nr:CpsD/CapB family tyrosine-protein kinase [Clostridia bacterium]
METKNTNKTSNDIVSNDNVSSAQQSRTIPFAVVESYKTIRTNLLFLLSNKSHNSITISSPYQSEGKSTTSVNTAIALSQLGSKVLLIDADLRRPSIHRKMKFQNSMGLSSVLVGFCTIDEAIHNVNANLDVLTSGPTTPNPSELLGSDSMSELLDTLQKSYEYIIIDTPPINIVTDALVLAPKTAGIMLVVKDNATRHDQLKKALTSIEFAGVRLLGLVLNATGGNGSYKYRYKYRYRYRYRYQYNYNTYAYDNNYNKDRNNGKKKKRR